MSIHPNIDMCGYFGNLHECPDVVSLMVELGIPLPYPTGQFYPRHTLPGLVTATEAGYQLSESMWWFAMRRSTGQWQINEKITSFNARNLQGPLWRDAVQWQRGVVFGTEIGESQDGKHYLMAAHNGFALAVLYRDWPLEHGKVQRSMAIITRPCHPRLERYHAKSTPCFLPMDTRALQHWLNPEAPLDDINAKIISLATLFSDFHVTQVKTFKRAEPLGPTQIVLKD